MMHRLFLVLALALSLFSGVFASPVPAPLDASSLEVERSSNTTELVERTSWHTNGRGTWFGPGVGACGWHNKASDHIVALSYKIYSKAHCGKMITIVAEGKTHSAQVVDKCPSCTESSLDMSPSLFSEFANESKGVITVKWKFD